MSAVMPSLMSSYKVGNFQERERERKKIKCTCFYRKIYKCTGQLHTSALGFFFEKATFIACPFKAFSCAMWTTQCSGWFGCILEILLNALTNQEENEWNNNQVASKRGKRKILKRAQVAFIIFITTTLCKIKKERVNQRCVLFWELERNCRRVIVCFLFLFFSKHNPLFIFSFL